MAGSSDGINVPSGIVLPKNRLQISPFFQTPAAKGSTEFSLTGMRASFGLFGYGEIGATILHSQFSGTQPSFDIVLTPLPKGVAGFHPGIGIRNVSSQRQVGNQYNPFDVAAGSQTALEDINTNSIFVAVSTHDNSLLEGTLGWGTGEFRGHGPINISLRGFFGQVSLNLGNLHGIFELDGRSLHAGISYDLSDRTKVTFAFLNGENLRQNPRRTGYRPGWGFRFSQSFDIGSKQVPESLAEAQAPREQAPVSDEEPMVEVRQPPETPTGLKAVGRRLPEDKSKVILTFDPPVSSEIAGYKIYMAKSNSNKYKLVSGKDSSGKARLLRYKPKGIKFMLRGSAQGHKFFIMAVDPGGHVSKRSRIAKVP